MYNLKMPLIVNFIYIYSNIIWINITGIEWGEDDDDDFELEENKDVKMSDKGGKEQIGITTELFLVLKYCRIVKGAPLSNIYALD